MNIFEDLSLKKCYSLLQHLKPYKQHRFVKKSIFPLKFEPDETIRIPNRFKVQQNMLPAEGYNVRKIVQFFHKSGNLSSNLQIWFEKIDPIPMLLNGFSNRWHFVIYNFMMVSLNMDGISSQGWVLHTAQNEHSPAKSFCYQKFIRMYPCAKNYFQPVLNNGRCRWM